VHFAEIFQKIIITT